MGTFYIYRDAKKEFRWRLRASNGEIIAVSESYISKQNAERSIQRVKVLAPLAPVVDLTITRLIEKLLNNK